MIELLIIVVAALLLVGLIWKAKCKKNNKAPGSKHASGGQQASSVAPMAQQTESKPATPTQAPAPIVTPTVPPVAAAPTAEKPASPCAADAKAVKIPEDSVLKRHYLAALQAEKDAISSPYPTDSVLHRHYDALHKIAIPQQPANTAEEATPSQSQAPAAVQAAASAKQNDPEDSVLHRHYLAQLRNEIETELPPRPTDSVLKRHHDHLVQAKLQQRLAAQ